MKNKIIIGGVLLGVFLAGVAVADVTVIYRSADAKVVRICFDSEDNGVNIVGQACGFTKDSLGVIRPKTCRDRVLPNGTFKTNAASMFTGAGLTFWKNEEGL